MRHLKIYAHILHYSMRVSAVILFFFGAYLDIGLAEELSGDSFRMGFSSSMFTEVNENDVLAAGKVWGQTLTQERGIKAEAESFILKDHAAMLDALRKKRIDVIALTSAEFGPLSEEIDFDPIFIADVGGGRSAVQYILLVHRNSGIETLSDLRGRNISFYQNPTTCLAEMWLDTLLLQKNLPAVRSFSAKVTADPKLVKVVLPVFFRQSDACVVTQGGFNTLKELNPQLAKQLKVIATSMELVAGLFAFRADYSPSFKNDLFAAVLDVHKSPVGKQIFTIFRIQRFERQSVGCLDSAMALMALHAKLNGAERKPF